MHVFCQLRGGKKVEGGGGREGGRGGGSVKISGQMMNRGGRALLTEIRIVVEGV